MLSWIRRNKRYILLGGVFLILLLLSMFFLGTNYGEILSRYFQEGEEYLKVVNENNLLSGEHHQEVTGLFSLTADYFQDLKAIYGFDYHMAHGTMIADYLVPIIAIFAGLNLHKRLRSTFALSAFRKGNYRQALITDVLKESCRTSLAVFIPYLIYLLFVYVFTMDGTAELGAYKYFLSDLLGERFFYDHVQLYYLIEGTIRFFFVPFAYSCMGQAVAICLQSRKYIILEPIILYFDLTALMGVQNTVNAVTVYFNPIMIMTNQVIRGYNSILLMMFTFGVLVLSGLAIWKKSGKVEL